MKNILISLLLLNSLTPAAQSLKEIEQDLLIDLKKISYWRFEGREKPGALDSIVKSNDSFSKKLLAYTNKDTRTLTYAFPELEKESLKIASSTDKQFRIYSWNTWTGGTMHVFRSIAQIKTTDKVASIKINVAEEDADGGCWYSEIFSINTSDKKVYLGYWHSQYSSSGSVQGIQLFSIENNGLNDSLQLIKTKTGIRNELYFEFDFFSVVDRKERPVKLIYCDEKEKTIKIPVVTEDLKVANKFITYKYKGKYFERLLK